MTNRPGVSNVVSDETEQIQGDSVPQLNIKAATAVSGAIRTTLGPRGSEKMLVDHLGEIYVTSNAMTIIEEMELEHPPAELVAEVAQSQHDVFGDGVTTAVVLTGELLDQASELLERGFHPTTIIDGYYAASRLAEDVLDAVAKPVDETDTEMLRNIARTAMAGNLGRNTDSLSECVVNAVRSVPDHNAIEYVKIKSLVEGGDSVFIQGCVVEKKPAHRGMPDRIEDADIAITDVPIELRDSDRLNTVNPNTAQRLAEFTERERSEIRRIVGDILEADPDVVICQQGIDDRVSGLLQHEGVLAIQYLVDWNIRRLAKSTGADIVSDVRDLDPSDLGHADLVEQRDVQPDVKKGFTYTYFRGCENPRSVAFLIRGLAEQEKNEIKRGVKDGFNAVRTAIDSGSVVPGGGAMEAELSARLPSKTRQFDSREQLAVDAFASALEGIPRLLAINAGADPVDAVTTLRSRHADGDTTAGLVTDGTAVDVVSRGIVEPTEIKKGAIASAAEATILVLRIDDIFMIDSAGTE